MDAATKLLRIMSDRLAWYNDGTGLVPVVAINRIPDVFINISWSTRVNIISVEGHATQVELCDLTNIIEPERETAIPKRLLLLAEALLNLGDDPTGERELTATVAYSLHHQHFQQLPVA